VEPKEVNMINYQVLSVKVEALDPNDEGFITIQVRENRLPLDDDGVPNGSSFYHRTVHMPDHDSSEDSPTVAAICGSIHTQEWKDKYTAKLDAEAAVIEAERVEQERVAAEAEDTKVAEQEAAAIAAQEAFDAKVAAAVAAALEA
jgi:hypothetical protein